MEVLAKLSGYKWMRAARSWRVFLELHADTITAAQLTAYIDSKLNISISGNETTIEMHPAFIVDVSYSKKKFTLVIETVQEDQAKVGVYLPLAVDCDVKITISPAGGVQPPPAPERGDVSPAAIQNMHATHFRNKRFWSFLDSQSGESPIQDERMCKETFKRLMQIQSMTDMSAAEFRRVMEDYSGYINQR